VKNTSTPALGYWKPHHETWNITGLWAQGKGCRGERWTHTYLRKVTSHCNSS